MAALLTTKSLSDVIHKDDDFTAFMNLMREAHEKVPMRLTGVRRQREVRFRESELPSCERRSQTLPVECKIGSVATENGYAKRNRRNRRTDRLYQARDKALPVEDEGSPCFS